MSVSNSVSSSSLNLSNATGQFLSFDCPSLPLLVDILLSVYLTWFLVIKLSAVVETYSRHVSCFAGAPSVSGFIPPYHTLRTFVLLVRGTRISFLVSHSSSTAEHFKQRLFLVCVQSLTDSETGPGCFRALGFTSIPNSNLESVNTS